MARIAGSREKGVHRTAWNLRYPASSPVGSSNPRGPSGPLALPGTYTVTMSSSIDGITTDLVGPQEFEVVELGINTFKADDLAEALLCDFKPVRLIDRYDVYQHLMTYWTETMQDDVFMLTDTHQAPDDPASSWLAANKLRMLQSRSKEPADLRSPGFFFG